MGTGFKILTGASILLGIFLIVGQSYSLLDYNSAVAQGLQESEAEIGKVGIAFAKGFAFGDTILYLPLLVGGIIGLLKRRTWGIYVLFASCAISVYWPLVHLYAIYIGRDTMVLQPEKYISFPITLSCIILYGLWGMWYLYHNRKVISK